MTRIFASLIAASALAACHSSAQATPGHVSAVEHSTVEPSCAPGGADTTHATYFEFQVGGAPHQLVAGPIREGKRGSFFVQFIIDTAGAPEPKSFLLVPGKGELPTDIAAVREGVERLRYEPATYHGCRVRLVLQEPWK